MIRNDNEPTAHDLGAERPGVDDETFVEPELREEAEDTPEEEEIVGDDAIRFLEPKVLDNPNRVKGKRQYGRNDPCPCKSGRKIKKCHPEIL
jgi:uncharacterized protein YchJ